MENWVSQYFVQERAIRLSKKLTGGVLYRATKPDKVPEYITNQKEFDIIYLISGKGEYVDKNNKRYIYSAGYIFKRYPGEVHSTKVTECPYCEMYFSLPMDVYPLLRKCHSHIVTSPHVMEIGLDHAIAQNFHMLIQEIKQVHEPMIPELIYKIICFCNDFMTAHKNEHNQLIKKACHLIDSELSSKMPLGKIAANVGIGYQNFRKIFQEQTGTTPGEYRIRKRIERACEMLAQGVPQKQIASLLGYSDVQGFSRQFHERMGIAPGSREFTLSIPKKRN